LSFKDPDSNERVLHVLKDSSSVTFLKPYFLVQKNLVMMWKLEHEGKGYQVPEIEITCFVFHVKRDERSAEMFSVMLT
jgi:hypothetical protein